MMAVTGPRIKYLFSKDYRFVPLRPISLITPEYLQADFLSSSNNPETADKKRKSIIIKDSNKKIKKTFRATAVP